MNYIYTTASLTLECNLLLNAAAGMNNQFTKPSDTI